jgi:hypothetical protein
MFVAWWLPMLDLSSLFEFSRNHCIAICAVLVPANLVATSQTMLWVWLRRPLVQVQLTAGAASFYALLLLLHVFTWFAIGVVMAPTFILTILGSVCLAINLCAVLYSQKRTENWRQFVWIPELIAWRKFSQQTK